MEIRAVDHRVPEMAARIHAVQIAAYAQEAELLGAVSFPPLRRSVLDVQRSNETFFAAFDQGELVGSVSVEPGEVSDEIWISSLTVDPGHHRRGIGRALVASVLHHYPLGIVCVSTGARNAPALALYAEAGFVEHARRTVGAEALPLVVLRRKAVEDEGGQPNGFEKVPAIVFGHLLPGELRVILAPGHGMGGATRDIPLELVPTPLRLPNTRIWVRLNEEFEVVRVWRRTVAMGHEPD